MARRNINKRKKSIVRDLYDGKIIKDKEAVSLRNIPLVIEKEGHKHEE